MSRESKHGVELCALLVDETYGELTSRIFTILLRRGRMPVQTLCKHTRLTPRHVRHGLAVLIQQNLVYYYHDSDTSTTYYEANDDAAYALVRSGKIIEVIESRFGAAAREIVRNLFRLGHTKVQELVESIQMTGEPSSGSGNGHTSLNGSHPNGRIETHNVSTGYLHTVLVQLLEAGFVEPVNEQMFRSPTDAYNMIEREMLQTKYGGSTKGNKQKDELKSLINDRLQQMRDDSQDWRPKTGKKRAFKEDLSNGHNGTGKKRRLSNGAAVNGDHVYEDDGTRLDPNLTLRINYEKCTVALRNQRLVELASIRIGETTSLIYSELLRLMENRIPRCRPDGVSNDRDETSDSPPVTTMEVAASLSKLIDVGHGIGKVSDDSIGMKASERPHKSPKRRVDEAEAQGEASSDEEETEIDTVNGNIPEVDHEESDGEESFVENAVQKAPKRQRVTFEDSVPAPEQSGDRHNRLNQLKNHLQLLANDSCGFLQKSGSRGQGEWTVNFERVVEFLREAELDQMLLENFGGGGHRLARMFRKLGKLEEKQLPGLAFMKQKDIRTKLAEMQMAGMIDIQEVPRDAGRTPARTMYLWYFDTERVSAILLDSFYKCMSRCFQRLDLEKRRVSDILTALQRQDTIGRSPEDVLEQEPLNRHRAFEVKEKLLLAQIGRLDELIGIFRDY